jgi:hypothetical protein
VANAISAPSRFFPVGMIWGLWIKTATKIIKNNIVEQQQK